MSEIVGQKKSCPSARTFFFAAFPNFFYLADLGNRFRLVDLGGVEPLRELVRQKVVPGTENKKFQEI